MNTHSTPGFGHRWAGTVRQMVFGGVLAAGLGWGGGSAAQPMVDVHLVWMGGDDCPPCMVWKRRELPRFQATPEGRSIRISGVDKTIRSPVPAVEQLPPEVRPYKAQLDLASAGRNGSPQMALLVNGKVYDYYFGTRESDIMVEMVQAVRTGSPYPVPRCVRLGPRGHQCEQPG
jgi:hypothetical protein